MGYICLECENPLTWLDLGFSRYQMFLCENCYQGYYIKDKQEGCSHDFDNRIKVASNGVKHVRQQCKKCEFISSSSMPGFSKEEKDLMTEINEESLRMQQEDYSNFWKTKSEGLNRIIASRSNNWWANYNKYLNSVYWIQKRNLALKRDNYLCQDCFQSRATQVHHLKYDFVDFKGSEPTYDLISLCKECHDKVEKLKSSKK